MPSDEQAILRANVRRLRMAKGLSIKELAEVANIHPETLYGNRVWGDVVIGRLAFALGVDVEQLFYYDAGSHEKAATPEEEWEGNVQKVRRYLRSISDPELRLRESRRLLKAAEVAVEEYEADLDRARGGRKAGGADGKKPGGGGKGGARDLVSGEGV